MKLNSCTALITGASAGLGQEFARQLAGRARSLVLVARRLERLEELRDELTKLHPNLTVHVRAADLSKSDAVDALCDELEKDEIPIDFLINNAGLGDHGTFATSDPERVNDMLQVNVVALTRLTRRLLPSIITGKHGAILNVSSSASFLPLANLGVYAATKAYVTSFSEALRTELRGTGVGVSALCPGPVHTEFGEVATRSGGKTNLGPEVTYVSVAQAVRAGIAAVEHDRPIAIPGWPMKLGILLVRMTPMPILRLASRFTR